MIRLAAFDFDGTLADTLPMCIKVFKRAMLPYVGHELSEDEIVATFGMNEAGMVKAIVGDRWEAATRDLYVMYEQMHDMCAAPFDGVVSLIEFLKARGVTVALVTGKGPRCCEISLQKLGMSGLFSDVMAGREYRGCKKDLLRELIEKYGLPRDECVYIGDAPSDVEISAEAGIRCLSAAWAETADIEALHKVNGGSVYESVSALRQALSSQIQRCDPSGVTPEGL